MKIKKILISLMALVVVASQFTGCADNKVMNNEKIVITAENTVYDRKGELSEIDWTALQEKTSNPNTRTIVDNYFSNHTNEKGIKYGTFYTDKDNNQQGNNTLFTVLGNEYVANTLATLTDLTDTNTFNKEIAQYLNKDYADLEESDYTSAMFNAYFELIPDSTPNYFNGGASLSRAEAMTLVMRAMTPVGTLEPDTDFETAVSATETPYQAYAPYASKENSNSYISTADGSLNKDNYGGTMTRAEYIYLALNAVYGTIPTASTTDTASNTDTSTATSTSASLSDCTSNPNIADTLKLTPASEQHNSACLQYALQHADKGLPDELYQAIATAYSKDIIPSETRWDEAITKTEAIEILIATMQAYYNDNGYPYNNADKGSTDSLKSDAKALWEKQDKNDMNCTEEEFIDAYITAISNGMTPEQFEESIPVNYSIKFAEEQALKEEQHYIDNLWTLYGEDKLTCDKDKFTEEYKAYAEEKGDSYNEEEFITYITEKYGKQETENTSTEEPSEQNEPSNSTENDDNTSSGNNSNSDNNASGNSSGNNSVYTPPADNNSSNNSNSNSNPVYTPPVDNSNNNSNGNNSSSNNDTPVYTPPAQQEPVYTPPVDNGNSNSGGNTSFNGDGGYNPFANGGGDLDFDTSWGHVNN